MNGEDVLAILLEKGIERLYHANSVATSCTFLSAGGLVSRGLAESRNWEQTPQYTDQIDKQYGIWHDVFLDTDDYHRRIRDRNQYGPITFVLAATALATSPQKSVVSVTRTNPTKWHAGQQYGDRYFDSVDQLRAGLSLGTFDQMITIRTPEGMMPFGRSLMEIRVDDPQLELRSGLDAFEHAIERLTSAATIGEVAAPIVKRTCRDECRCLGTYKGKLLATTKLFG